MRIGGAVGRAALVLAGMAALGAAQEPAPGGAAPAAGNPAAEGGPLAIGRRIFDALNDARAAQNVAKVPFSAKVYISLQDHLDALVRDGYRGGPPGKKYPKCSARAFERHGWNLTVYDNYSNGKRSSLSPADIITLLKNHPQIKSLMRTDLNCGAAAATEIPGTDDLCIVLGLAREPKSFEATRAKVDAAEAELAKADAAKRKNIVRALAGMREIETLLALTAAVRDADASVRAEAAKGCAALGDPYPVDALLDCFEKDPEAAVKAEARKALEAISGHREYGDIVAKWRAWWDVDRAAFKKK